MPVLSSALIVLVALSFAVERVVEAVGALVWPDVPSESQGEAYRRVRRPVAMLLGILLGLILAFVFKLRLATDVFQAEGVSEATAMLLTGVVIGGAVGPVHEFIRWLELKKEQAKA